MRTARTRTKTATHVYFAFHEGVGTLTDSRRQLFHAIVSLVGSQDHPGVVGGQNEGRHSGQQRGDQYGV